MRNLDLKIFQNLLFTARNKLPSIGHVRQKPVEMQRRAIYWRLDKKYWLKVPLWTILTYVAIDAIFYALMELKPCIII